MDAIAIPYLTNRRKGGMIIVVMRRACGPVRLGMRTA